MNSEVVLKVEKSNTENEKKGSRLRKAAVPLLMLSVFWFIGLQAYLATGFIMALVNFGFLGTALGLGLGLYSFLPKKKKPMGRKFAQFMIGGYMLLFMGILINNNVQIEGFFFGIITGVAGAGIMHYLMAKVLGPLLFGRLWCGWACWTAMVLDLQPFSKSPGRRAPGLGYISYVHFVLSFILVYSLVLIFGPSIGLDNTFYSLFLVLAGNVFYYAVAIGMAYRYKDNRAFCKYLCPITTILKVSSRFSLIKVKGDADKCTNCRACVKACPMDIQIPDYISQGKRVLSTECTLCQTCINTCPHGVLSLSAGIDLGGKDLLKPLATNQ
ncbi:MAG: 4Fe-4S binding protein [Candidatus Thorarchaeota archaeon]